MSISTNIEATGAPKKVAEGHSRCSLTVDSSRDGDIDAKEGVVAPEAKAHRCAITQERTMDRSSRAAKMVVRGAIVLMIAYITAGCGASWEQSRVPFYLYGSPLISGASDSKDSHPEEKTEPEPTETGTRYALNEAGEAAPVEETEQSAGIPEESKAQKPDSEKKNQTETTASTPKDSLKKAANARPVSREPEGDADLTYVAEVMRVNRVDLPDDARSSLAGLYKHCRDSGEVFQDESPAAGDIVFFHNTADANGDGRNNDWYTHAAVVVGTDGPVVRVIGYRGGKVREFVLNRQSPEAHKSDGDVVNTQLRPVRQSDAPYTRYLSGQLFAGYCSLLGNKRDVIIMENWQPGMDVKPPAD